MDENAKKALVASADIAANRVETVVMRWAQVGHTAAFMGCLGRKLRWLGPRSAKPSTARPWLRQKKGRGAQ